MRFFDEKCFKLQGRCVKSCQKNEELVALCQRALKCCFALQPCSDSDKKEYIKKKPPRTTDGWHLIESCEIPKPTGAWSLDAPTARPQSLPFWRADSQKVQVQPLSWISKEGLLRGRAGAAELEQQGSRQQGLGLRAPDSPSLCERKCHNSAGEDGFVFVQPAGDEDVSP
ncbi:hypothetical protein QTO34_014965 [Cnephaeus nilssonii]|uniref:Beta-defensin n=1 Tax=Cnephaeus nilssonii TaxID=3371016 RepID=A0AA40LUL1_CNENI|nr:hypothetical protein QTO34_014965 [Eptesicus nilssonii]